jgi:hypothetical protein
MKFATAFALFAGAHTETDRRQCQFHGSSSSLNGMVGDALQNVGEPGLRIDVVHLGCLCRPPNYAELQKAPVAKQKPPCGGSWII